MYLGDNLIGEGVSHLFKRFEKKRLYVLILLREVDDLINLDYSCGETENLLMSNYTA